MRTPGMRAESLRAGRVVFPVEGGCLMDAKPRVRRLARRLTGARRLPKALQARR